MRQETSRAGFYGRLLSCSEIGGFKLNEYTYRPGERLPKHSHERSYFCMTVQGCYREGYNAHTYLCSPLTLAFYPVGAKHSVNFGSTHVLTFNVELQSDWMARFEQCEIELDRPGYYQGGPAAWLALRLYEEYKAMDALSSLVIEGLMLEIVAATSRSSRSARRRPPAWLKQAREFIHDNFNQSLTLKAIARSAGIHPVHLATSFRQHYRTTVGDYLRKLRVDAACREMVCADKPLSEIAAAAGFFDQSHFSKTFKQLIGVPPSRFRRSLEKN